MRILYFSRIYSNHDRRFLSTLVESGHEVAFLQLERKSAALERRPMPETVEAYSLEADGVADGLDKLAHLKNILVDIKPDIVQAGPVTTCGFLIATLDFHPFVAMSWGYDLLVDANVDAQQGDRARFALTRADLAICDCETVRRRLQSLVSFPADKIVQLPFGTDVATFRPRAEPGDAIREKLGWNHETIVVSVRKWEKLYDVDVLITAFALAHRNDTALRLLLLGDGSMAPELRDLIAEYGIQDAVAPVGHVSHDLLPAYLQASDIYMSCSKCDGTSVSLLEAMATGLPVLVTDTDSNREWVIPDVNGRLGETGNTEDFARQLNHLASAPRAELERMAKSNRRVAERRANWEKNVQGLLQAYAKLQVP